MAKIFLFQLLLICSSAAAVAQTFADKCTGIWAGTMYMYYQGKLKDSVAVKLTVAKTADTTAWIWKTEYLSTTTPVTKDYILRLKDRAANIYITDEGDGIALTGYFFEDKLYGIFETGGIMLTSSYELVGNELIFEVTSGKKVDDNNKEIVNYSVTNLQKIIFKKLD